MIWCGRNEHQRWRQKMSIYTSCRPTVSRTATWGRQLRGIKWGSKKYFKTLTGCCFLGVQLVQSPRPIQPLRLLVCFFAGKHSWNSGSHPSTALPPVQNRILCAEFNPESSHERCYDCFLRGIRVTSAGSALDWLSAISAESQLPVCPHTSVQSAFLEENCARNQL